MRRTWSVLAGSAVVLGAILAGPAQSPASASVRSYYGVFDTYAGLAGNLNSPVLVGVSRTDGQVRYRDTGGSGWRDIGSPMAAGEPPVPVKKVATSAGWIYAIRADRQLFGWGPDSRVWEHLRDGVTDVLASRHLSSVRPLDGPPRLEPDLYVVDTAGRVVRRMGNEWTILGGAVAGFGSLAELGPAAATQLFVLRWDNEQVLRWDAPVGLFRSVGGPASTIAANLDTVVIADLGTGEPLAWNAGRGAFDPVLEPSGSPGPPLTAGAQVWLGQRTIYYRAGGGTWGQRVSVSAGGTVAVLSQWRLWSRGPVNGVATFAESVAGVDAAVIADGRISPLVWGSLLGGSAALYGHVNEPISVELDVALPTRVAGKAVASTVPPGLHAGIDELGRVIVAGVPSRTGRTDLRLAVWDDAANRAEVVVHITIAAPGAVLPPNPPPPADPSSVSYANCLFGGATMPVFVRDRTAGGAWTSAGTFPPGGVTDLGGGGDVLCAPTAASTATVALLAGHVYDVATLNPADPHCAGATDPDLPPCVVVAGRFRGGSAPRIGPLLVYSLTLP